MKTNFFKWLLLLFVLVVLSGCNKNIMMKNLVINPNPLILTSDAQTKYVKVENLLNIHSQDETDIEEEGIYIKNDWIKMTFNRRINPRNIVVDVTENMSPNNRIYNLRLDSYNEGDILEIIQKGKTD